MTGEQLFESLQYLDDALLDGAYRAPRLARQSVLRRAALAAACLALIVGAAALLRTPRVQPKPQPGAVSTPQAVSGKESDPIGARSVERVGVPGPGAEPGAFPAPEALVWNELLDTAAGADWDLAQGVILVAEPLTQAQLAACAPEIRTEWMEQAEGFAAYFLKDGEGGLAYAELWFTDPARAGKVTVRIRNKNAAAIPSFGMAGDCLAEEEKVGTLNGMEYRAYRLRYLHGEGDPAVSPPEGWVELSAVFEKEGLEYRVCTDAPLSAEDAAAQEMLDLLLAYAGTHAVPDLASYRYGAAEG